MYCTETTQGATATQAPTAATTSPPSSTLKGRKKKLVKRRKKKIRTGATPVPNHHNIVDRIGVIPVPDNTSSEDDFNGTLISKTTVYSNMARSCDFEIVNQVSSNGKMSKPICKRKGIPTISKDNNEMQQRWQTDKDL